MQRQQAQGWGAEMIERLARDLKEAFPDSPNGEPTVRLSPTDASADSAARLELPNARI